MNILHYIYLIYNILSVFSASPFASVTYLYSVGTLRYLGSAVWIDIACSGTLRATIYSLGEFEIIMLIYCLYWLSCNYILFC